MPFTSRLYTVATILLSLFFVIGCNTYDPEFNAPTIPERLTFTAARQYPEGITYSPEIAQFLVSSITQGKVGAVDQNGRYTDLIVDDRQLISAIGMKVRNSLLYVCNGDQGVSTKSSPQTAFNTAGLFIYDLRTLKNLRRINLATLAPATNHFANDIAFDANGNVYVTDSFAPVIYKIPVDSTQPSTVISSPLFAGTQGFNLNGIVYHPNNFLIVVKSNEGKLFKVDLTNTNTITEVAGANLPQGDGMLLYNGDLYVVNNQKQVSQVHSEDNWKTASIVKTDAVGYSESTTNVLVNNVIYTLNARIGEVNAAVTANDPTRLQANTYSIQQFKQ